MYGAAAQGSAAYTTQQQQQAAYYGQQQAAQATPQAQQQPGMVGQMNWQGSQGGQQSGQTAGQQGVQQGYMQGAVQPTAAQEKKPAPWMQQAQQTPAQPAMQQVRFFFLKPKYNTEVSLRSLPEVQSGVISTR